MNKVFKFTGCGSITVKINKDLIRIKGKRGSFSNNELDCEQNIDIKNLICVHMKKPGLTSGYFQFIFKGNEKSKGRLFAALKDENTIMFVKREQYMVEEIKEYIENFFA